MSKHTRGQWLVAGKESNDSAYEGRTIYSEYGRICDLTILRPAHENAANARLIAAAPELLKLIKTLVMAYDESWDRGVLRWGVIAEVAEPLIARIEGETDGS